MIIKEISLKKETTDEAFTEICDKLKKQKFL